MSLLLDALKKAAQKKAKKSGALDENIESTEIADYEKTVANTRYDETAVTDTVESTEYDITSITDSVEFDSGSAPINQDTQISDTIEIAAVSIDKTEINAASPDSSHLSDNTEIDTTHIDETEINETSFDVDQTQIEQDTQFLDATEVGSTSIEKTEMNMGFDEFKNDEVKFDNDITEVGEDVKFADKTEIDVTSLDETEVESDTATGDQSSLAEETQTLSISEDTSGSAVAASTETDVLYQTISGGDEESLTEDDVTQFMGDGSSSQSSYNSDEDRSDAGIGDDDTTLTSSESLTLTNFSFDDQESDGTVTGEYQPITSYTEGDEHSFEEVDQTSIVGINQQELPDDEKLTRINVDDTSTVSSVDIEKLTNDETVTVGGSTATKTFAPDNYDRTLLNLSDKDVSNIFPGMRPDSDTVMTPDYAKRIFLSKSGQANTRYFKLYAGISIVSLLLVIMWGLFQFQEESERVEQSLMSLKRDPMPGIIKPQTEKLAKGVFDTQSSKTEIKTVDLLAKAEESGGSEYSQLKSEANASTSTGEVVETVESLSSEVIPVDQQNIPGNIIPTANKKPVQPASKPVSSSGLMISSSRQASSENQLLMEAYDAYEQGDMVSAKARYDEVLSLDESNRDGLLGRAAIHVLDNEYQQAIDKYQRLLLSNPKDGMAMAALISVASIDPQTAETQLKSLLREEPESPYLHFVLGNMYGNQNRWSEAQSAYFEALQKKPNDPNYAYNLAVSLEHIGKSGTALTFYQRALENSSKGLVTFNQQLVMQRLEVLAQ